MVRKTQLLTKMYGSMAAATDSNPIAIPTYSVSQQIADWGGNTAGPPSPGMEQTTTEHAPHHVWHQTQGWSRQGHSYTTRGAVIKAVWSNTPKEFFKRWVKNKITFRTGIKVRGLWQMSLQQGLQRGVTYSIENRKPRLQSHAGSWHSHLHLLISLSISQHGNICIFILNHLFQLI